MPSHSHQGTVVTSNDEGDRSDPSGAFPARESAVYLPLLALATALAAMCAVAGIDNCGIKSLR